MLFAFLAVAATPITPVSKEVCKVGRVALRDLPLLESNNVLDTYYDGATSDESDLLEMCPQLRRDIPARFPIADDQARARTSVHVPVPGAPVRGTFIYRIAVPEFSEDLSKATVHFIYSCSGLCSGTTDAHYVRTPAGWVKREDFSQCQSLSNISVRRLCALVSIVQAHSALSQNRPFRSPAG
jgi:hypothetical protein